MATHPASSVPSSAVTDLGQRNPLAAPLQTPEDISIWDANQGTATSRFDGLQRVGLEASPEPVTNQVEMAAQQLLADLHQLLMDHGSLMPEQADEINRFFSQLAQQGQDAVPLIREYLDQGHDVNFDTLEGGKRVNYPSLRVGLVDALLQIGTPKAMTGVGEALATAIDPLEIGLVAHELERLQPGQYRDLAVTAARDILASGLVGGHDPAPLFEILQTFGGANVTNDLEQAVAVYGSYATLALANLPDGLGIPSLLRLAHDPELAETRIADSALQMLAQVALQHAAAREALSSPGVLSRIPDRVWPSISGSLAGTSYLRYGNPLYVSSHQVFDWSAEEIQQRVHLIDQLLTATNNAVALGSLQDAKTALLSQLRRKESIP